MRILIEILVMGLLMGCSGTIKQGEDDGLALPDSIDVGQSTLSRDSIAPFPYPVLTAEQRDELMRQSGLEVPDSIRLLGTRQIEGKFSLAAYLIPLGENPSLFKVYLITRDNDGAVIDALDLREFHASEYQGRPRFGGNRFYTRDATLTFDGQRRFTQHVVMTLTSLYLKDHRLTEMWRIEWDNNYEITADGHFRFLDQHETYRSDDIDDPTIPQYQSHDLPHPN